MTHFQHPTRLALAILLLAAPAMAEPVAIPQRQIWVVDGDTVHWQHGRLPPGCAVADHEACRPYERVRLHAIDAPETGARAWYADLWDRINGPGAWARNDWVIATTFQPIAKNVSEVTP